MAIASSTLTALQDPAFATDLSDGRIIAWNDAATELTGFSRAEAMAGTCGALMDGIDDAGSAVCAVECAYRRVSRGRQRGGIPFESRDRLPGTCAGWERHPDMRVRTTAGRRNVFVVTLPALIDGRPAMLHVLRPGELASAAIEQI